MLASRRKEEDEEGENQGFLEKNMSQVYQIPRTVKKLVREKTNNIVCYK